MEPTTRTLVTRILLLMVTAVLASQAGCIAPSSSNGKIIKQPFGSTSDGTPVDLYILQNNTGAEAKITNYGGIVTSLKVSDRNGDLGDVVLGYNELAGYLKDSPYFGALI